jgi:hypothetical protein
MAEAATIPCIEEPAITPRPLHELVPALITVMEQVRDAMEADGDWEIGAGVLHEAGQLAAEARAALIGEDAGASERRDLIDAWWSVGVDEDLEVPRLDDIRTTLAWLVVRAGYVGGGSMIPTRRALFAAYVELVVLTATEDGRDDTDWEPTLSQLIQAHGLLQEERRLRRWSREDLLPVRRLLPNARRAAVTSEQLHQLVLDVSTRVEFDAFCRDRLFVRPTGKMFDEFQRIREQLLGAEPANG